MKHIVYILFFLVFQLLLVSCSDDIDETNFDPKNPEISIENNEFNFPKEGGQFSVKVTSNLPWRAKSNSNWITIENESALEDGEFIMNIVNNRSTEERVGEVIVWITEDIEKSIKIFQAPSLASDLINHYYVKTTGSDTQDGLSWTSPTTLSNAISIMAPGDYIHIAEGTYIPTNMVTGGNQEGDITFEIHSNVTLIGGYAADAAEGAVPDANKYETILSGNNEFYHTMTITAPIVDDNKVIIKNLSIKDGLAGESSAGTLNINGATYRRSYGGGLSIGKSVVDFENCVISNNQTKQHAGGVYVHSGSVVTFMDSDISYNKNDESSNATNGGGLFNESSTVYLINCNVIGNSVTGVAGGLYTFSGNTPTYLYLYNSTVANNTTNSGTATTRRGGGIYIREFSRVQIVNSTFVGNEAGKGGGISMYGAVGKEASMDLINSTIYDNYSINNAGGVEILSNTTFNAYSSIITGNRANESVDFDVAANTSKLSFMITGTQVLDNEGEVISGETFDPSTMISTLEDNGGRTETCMISSSSPAASKGMNVDLLKALAIKFTPPIDIDIITKDQIGNSRDGKTFMGAVLPK